MKRGPSVSRTDGLFLRAISWEPSLPVGSTADPAFPPLQDVRPSFQEIAITEIARQTTIYQGEVTGRTLQDDFVPSLPSVRVPALASVRVPSRPRIDQYDGDDRGHAVVEVGGVPYYVCQSATGGLDYLTRTLVGIDVRDNVIRERTAPEVTSGISAPAYPHGPTLNAVGGTPVYYLENWM